MARKKRKKRLNVKRLIVFVLIIYLFVSGTIKLINEPIRNIIITGNYYVSDYEIITLAGIKNYPAMMKLNITKMKDKINSKGNKLWETEQLLQQKIKE